MLSIESTHLSHFDRNTEPSTAEAEEFIRGMDPFRTQLQVVGALVLRDMRTRFGRSHLSYLTSLILPLGHGLIILGVWTFVGNAVPIGTSPVIYFGTGILPFVVFSYPFRQIALAVVINKPLLYFPRVKVIDIMLARILLEAVTAGTVVTVFLIAISAYGEEIRPHDAFISLSALCGALYFGIAFGMLNGLIASIYPGWTLPMNLFVPLMWVSSGTLFSAEAVPAQYRDWLAINPLLQCVELVRQGYYADYRSSIVSVSYVVGLPTTLIALVLLAERQIRGRILGG